MSSRTGSPPRPPDSSSAETPGGPAWLSPAADGVIVRVHAQPGASRSRVAGVHGGALKIQVRARPVEGAANEELVAVLARALAVRPGAVTLESGAAGREKRLRIRGIDAGTARARLAPFVDKGRGAD